MPRRSDYWYLGRGNVSGKNDADFFVTTGIAVVEVGHFRAELAGQGSKQFEIALHSNSKIWVPAFGIKPLVNLLHSTNV
jgi:hypothetical protein